MTVDVHEEPAFRLRRRFEGLLGIPATEGNQLTLLRNGDQIFPAMLEAIRGATNAIDFLTFVYWRGSIAEDFAEALSQRAEAGVDDRGRGDVVEIEQQLVEELDALPPVEHDVHRHEAGDRARCTQPDTV